MSKKEKEAERENAIARLREMVKPGDTVYTVLRHVSRSGMQRSISVVIVQDGVPHDMSWAVARVLEWRFDRDRDGIKVNGCGMDMGFHLVYSLSYALYPKGFGCVGPKCPSNDHSNGDRDYTLHGADMHGKWEHGGAAAHWHRDGGYALTQRWL